MTAVRIVTAAGSNNVGAGLTNYQPPVEGASLGTTTETQQQVKARAAGTYSNLYARFASNAATGTSTVKFRKGGSNGNQTISITAGTTGEFEDTTNSDAVVAGDLLAVQLVNGGGGTINWVLAAVTFAATTNTSKRMGSNGGSAAQGTASTTYYEGLGLWASNTTEAQAQFKVRTTATAKNLQINVASNSRSDATTFRTRKNGANGGQSISITAGTTGVFEDTTNTDSLVATDLFNFALTLGAGTGSINARTSSVEFETTDGSWHFAGGAAAGIAQSANLTNYLPSGGAGTSNSTEANTQSLVKLAGTLSFLGISVTANTVTAASTFKLRKNAANANQVVTITASTTGYFEDTTNSDTVAATDRLDVQLVTGATGTSLTYTEFGARFTQGSGTAYVKALTQTSATPTSTALAKLGWKRVLTQVSAVASQALGRIWKAKRVITQTSATPTSTTVAKVGWKRGCTQLSAVPSQTLGRRWVAKRAITQQNATPSSTVQGIKTTPGATVPAPLLPLIGSGS